jgi:hypothetical protein
MLRCGVIDDVLHRLAERVEQALADWRATVHTVCLPHPVVLSEQLSQGHAADLVVPVRVRVIEEPQARLGDARMTRTIHGDVREWFALRGGKRHMFIHLRAGHGMCECECECLGCCLWCCLCHVVLCLSCLLPHEHI